MIFLAWLACLGTYQPASTALGPYTVRIPPDLRASVDLADPRTVLAAHQGTADSEVLGLRLRRPVQVPDGWSDGDLPPAFQDQQTQAFGVRYADLKWLGGPANLGHRVSPSGALTLSWTAIRDGWLHTLECSLAEGGSVEPCHRIAASLSIRQAPTESAPLPTVTETVTVDGWSLPVPSGWERLPADPQKPERLIWSQAPMPTPQQAAQVLGSVRVELYPGVHKLGMWVDALNGAFQERGANLVNQDIYDGTTGDVFRSEYTRGVESAFTFDTVTPHGLLHMECRENVRRKQSIDLLCRQMFARIHGPKP